MGRGAVPQGPGGGWQSGDQLKAETLLGLRVAGRSVWLKGSAWGSTRDRHCPWGSGPESCTWRENRIQATRPRVMETHVKHAYLHSSATTVQTGSKGQEPGRHGGWRSELAGSCMERMAHRRDTWRGVEPGVLARRPGVPPREPCSGLALRAAVSRAIYSRALPMVSVIASQREDLGPQKAL